MTGTTGPLDLPSYAAVLEGLRHASFRQVVRYRHDPLFDALVQMGFIAWIRQPMRLSRQPVSARPGHYHAPIEIAGLTVTGYAALDWLTGLEHTPQWSGLRPRPYGMTCEPEQL